MVINQSQCAEEARRAAEERGTMVDPDLRSIATYVGGGINRRRLRLMKSSQVI